ncbi:MAG: acetylxylan esterase [Prevotella sp.]|nr:acetylxylan esterase [Prevotella sp.]
MKKLIFTWVMMLCLSATAMAENYPYRSDYLWVTVPDHSDWLYETGEKAVIDIQFLKYGIPRDGVVEYTIGNDMLEDDAKGEVTLKNGKAKVNMGTRKTPGFRDLRLKVKVDGKTYSHHIKVGFSVDKIKPFTKEPADFKAFWNNNIEEMRKTKLSYTKELAKEYCTDKMDCYLVKLIINRQKQAVYSYLFIPKNAAKGSCPIVMCPPGAGIKTIKEPLRHRYYGENGCIRFEMEIHGLDPRISAETFNEISKAYNGSENGYLSNGLDNKDRYYMKRVYLSLVRSIDFLTTLPEWDGRNVAVQGGSQGGALAIIAAGLDSRVTQCVANHPALSDMAAYSVKGTTGGYPHFNRTPGMFTKENINTMAYYDVVNFARYVKADTYVTWGYNDDVCPPTTSYAVWNTLQCPKEALITPINEHWTSDVTERGHLEWIQKHLK